ncbi:unnamed protein product [Polarella glacialis]|uniref:EF-hand domain-containing protein n=1 Tax=Polarella glacialis TaxID=89957 RepID=A0A813HAP8_POLGL|nr:unnamed protein product [Polarella glacialis]
MQHLGLLQEVQRPRTQAALSLRSTLTEQFHQSLKDETAYVFYVCGHQVAQKYGLYRGLQATDEMGVVVVPREDEEPLMETPSQLVFVADPCCAKVAGLSGLKVRAAIRAGNNTEAAQAMAPAAARYLLAPTETELLDHQADFEKLGVQPFIADPVVSRDKLKEALSSRLGPKAMVPVNDLSKLLQALDPSWTHEELSKLFKASEHNCDGNVSAVGFVDWLFTVR